MAHRREPEVRPAELGPDGVVHEVGLIQYLLSEVLHVRAPHSRCGVLLTSDPEKSRPDPGTLRCPRCKAIRESKGG